MKRKRNIQSLREAGYHYLGARSRSRLEMKRYLQEKARKWQLDLSDSEIVLTELEHHNLLNDQEFGGDWVSSKVQSRSFGPQKLHLQLRQKGLSADDVESALNKISDEEWLSAATRALNKFLQKKQFDSETEQKQKAFQFLLRKGFSLRIANRAFDALLGKG